MRTVGAWLWAGKRAVAAGLAAAALHGSSWIDDDVPVEFWQNTHPPAGLVVRNERLDDDEVTRIAGLPVTSRVRTAFDIGRRFERDEAVARLDALMRTDLLD